MLRRTLSRIHESARSAALQGIRIGVAFLFFGVGADAQQWTWQNPLPTNYTIMDAGFADSLTGWIVGNEGKILKTEDGGATWTWQDSGIRWQIQLVDAVNRDHAWAWAYQHQLLKTDDGGGTWIEAEIPCDTTAFKFLHFLSPDTGWILGISTWMTIDRGNSWAERVLPDDVAILTASVLSIDTIRACGGTHVVRTDNGGITWEAQVIDSAAGDNIRMRMIEFSDANHGWLTASMIRDLWQEPPRNYRTVDGGVTWILWDPPVIGWFNEMRFIGNEGWGVGPSALDSATHILHTADGGETWNDAGAVPDEWFLGIDFVEGGSAYFFGDDGVSYKAVNGCTEWVSLMRGPRSLLSDIAFRDSLHGWVVGRDNTLAKTDDGGLTWNLVTPPIPNFYLSGIAFSGFHGIIVADSGDILFSRDGGATWSQTESALPAAAVFGEVSMPDAERAFAVDLWGGIASSTDGGEHWEYQSIWDEFYPSEIAYTDSVTGWVAGYSPSGEWSADGAIYHTTDNVNWTQQLLTPGHYIKDIFFLNSQQGWAIGDLSGFDGHVYSTEDAGDTWEIIAAIEGLRGYELFFSDESTGWMVGSHHNPYPYQSNGSVWRTNDGGFNWQLEDTVALHSLTDISVAANGDVWVCGNNGTILRWDASSSSITTRPHNTAVPQLSVSLFPNPFNSSTTLSFELAQTSPVEVVMYDVLGRMVRAQAFGVMQAGQHQVGINASDLSSGSYWVRLQANRANEVRKVVVVR